MPSVPQLVHRMSRGSRRCSGPDAVDALTSWATMLQRSCRSHYDRSIVQWNARPSSNTPGRASNHVGPLLRSSKRVSWPAW